MRVLVPDRLLDEAVAKAQQAAQLALLARRHPDTRHQVGAGEVGKFAAVELVALLLGARDGLERRRMSDGQIHGVGLESVVDPAAEHGGFERALPRRGPRGGPRLKLGAQRLDRAFVNDCAGGGLGAIGNGFFVNVESDKVHFVLLGLGFGSPACRSRARLIIPARRTLFLNHLCIETGNTRVRRGGEITRSHVPVPVRKCSRKVGR